MPTNSLRVMRNLFVALVVLLLCSQITVQSTHAQGDEPVMLHVDWQSVEELAQVAGDSINEFWAAAFANANLDYDPPHNVGWYTPPFRWRCGKMPAGNAAYCSAEHGIAWEYNFFYSQWQEIGDFAPVTILAHEWGHLVQANLGLLSSPYAELQADCLAGAYASYAQAQGLLEPGDLEEAAVSLFQAGDPRLPWFTPRTHGRPEERVIAFSIGFGDLGDCFTTYQ